MSKIIRFPSTTVPTPTRKEIATKELKYTRINLEGVEHNIVALNNFDLEQHLKETADYLFTIEEAGDEWVVKHVDGTVIEKCPHRGAAIRALTRHQLAWMATYKNSTGYAIRYDDQVWPDIARLFHLPLVEVQGEKYILVYEDEIITTAKLAAYQATSLGYVDPSMVDVVMSEAFRKIIREKFGVELLEGALDRLTW